jgi:urease accessory protein
MHLTLKIPGGRSCIACAGATIRVRPNVARKPVSIRAERRAQTYPVEQVGHAGYSSFDLHPSQQRCSTDARDPDAGACAPLRAVMSVVIRTETLGCLDTFAVGARTVERVSVRSDDLAKRVLRFSTGAGEIGLRFEGSERLHDGDVIFADERLVVAVVVAADDVLVFEPGSIHAAIGIAHALGNRHLPIQAEGDAIVVRYDPLLESLGAEHGVTVRREQRVIAQPFRHAHAPHAHD